MPLFLRVNSMPVPNEEAARRITQTVLRSEAALRNRTPRRPNSRPIVQRKLIGKTDAAITKGNSGTISVYQGTTKGSETDSGVNVTAYNRFADLASGVWVHVEWINGGWELTAAEC